MKAGSLYSTSAGDRAFTQPFQDNSPEGGTSWSYDIMSSTGKGYKITGLILTLIEELT